MSKPTFRILITGQVDHGKSTLIGRLLHECGQMAPEVKTRLEAIAQQQGLKEIEWAFALDSLELERQQGITLDASRIWLKREERDIVLIDVPGHHELLGNMLTGASDAQAALMLVDAMEGVTRQTRLHAKLVELMGIQHVIVVVTKMDAAGYSQQVFEQRMKEAESLFSVPARGIPISAKTGENLLALSALMPWYKHQPLMHYLDQIPCDNEAEKLNQPMRLCVQDVVKLDDKRVITGKILSGQLAVGDSLVSCPSGSMAAVKEWISWPPDSSKTIAVAGESIALCLNQPIFSQRGEIFAHADSAPYFVHECKAQLIWLGDASLTAHTTYTLRVATARYKVTLGNEAGALRKHELGELTIHSRGLMVVDKAGNCPGLSRFVLEDEQQRIIAAGVMYPTDELDHKTQRLSHKSTHISPYGQAVTRERFEQRQGHKGGVFWLSGLSGAGKSTLAVEVQKMLFERGFHVVILDGDNLRSGLCRDLGFSDADRNENIRRAAEVARLFAMHGSVVITAFITPSQMQRELVGNIAGDYVRHVYVKADLEVCEKRDTKGLYKLARAGKIENFTGISAPFEEPVSADMTIETARPLSESITELLYYIQNQTRL